MKNIRYDFHKHITYWECPKKFIKKYNREEATVPQNGYYRVAGEFVQKFFEMYANKWKKENVYFTEAKISAKMEAFWEALLRWNPVDWRHPMSRLSESELREECIKTIHKNLEELDVYDDTKSEIKFVVRLKSGDELVAKIDFLKNTEDGEVVILDGKNSNKMGVNVDPRQLLFYALLYRMKYGKLPDKVGFLYYKHTKIEFVPFVEEDVEDLWKDILRTMIHIKKAKAFPATPSAKSCKYCDYLNTCEEGTADMNSRKRGKRDIMKGVELKKVEEGLYYIGVN